MESKRSEAFVAIERCLALHACGDVSYEHVRPRQSGHLQPLLVGG